MKSIDEIQVLYERTMGPDPTGDIITRYFTSDEDILVSELLVHTERIVDVIRKAERLCETTKNSNPEVEELKSSIRNLYENRN
jgi:hypothetical protein